MSTNRAIDAVRVWALYQHAATLAVQLSRARGPSEGVPRAFEAQHAFKPPLSPAHQATGHAPNQKNKAQPETSLADLWISFGHPGVIGSAVTLACFVATLEIALQLPVGGGGGGEGLGDTALGKIP